MKSNIVTIKANLLSIEKGKMSRRTRQYREAKSDLSRNRAIKDLTKERNISLTTTILTKLAKLKLGGGGDENSWGNKKEENQKGNSTKKEIAK